HRVNEVARVEDRVLLRSRTRGGAVSALEAAVDVLAALLLLHVAHQAVVEVGDRPRFDEQAPAAGNVNSPRIQLLRLVDSAVVDVLPLDDEAALLLRLWLRLGHRL